MYLCILEMPVEGPLFLADLPRFHVAQVKMKPQNELGSTPGSSASGAD